MSATAALAEFGISTPTSTFPSEVVHAGRRAILDTMGVALAGSRELPAHLAVEYISNRGSTPESTIWGTGSQVTSQDAAMANGIAAHVLDFDDTNDSMRGHPSVPILPAVFAMGERADTSGLDVLAAFIVGVEAACKLGYFTGQDPYDHGWHVTATHGLIGATVGAGRLAGLSVGQLRHAIGIAVSFTGGVRGNFGTMTKALHVGRAAQSAIMAVELAQIGFTASTTAIEDDFGYWAVFGRDSRCLAESFESSLGSPFDIVSPGLNVKAYPCCASTHAAIDAVLSVREGLSADDVERVDVSVPYTAPLILIHHRPSDPLSAKFSLEYCVAAALLDGPVTLEHFTQTSVNRPDLQSLLRRVTHIVPPEWNHDDGTVRTGLARVDVQLKGGTIRHGETTAVLGSPARPLSDDELEAKFISCASLIWDTDKSQHTLETLRRLDQLPSIRELGSVLSHSYNTPSLA